MIRLTAAFLSLSIAAGDACAEAARSLAIPACLETAAREGLQACESGRTGTITLVSDRPAPVKVERYDAAAELQAGAAPVPRKRNLGPGWAPALCEYWGAAQVVGEESAWKTTAKAFAFPFVYPFVQVKTMAEYAWSGSEYARLYEESSGAGGFFAGLLRGLVTGLAALGGAGMALIGLGFTLLGPAYVASKLAGRGGPIESESGRGIRMERDPDCSAKGIF